MEAAIHDGKPSTSLRKHLAERYAQVLPPPFPARRPSRVASAGRLQSRERDLRTALPPPAVYVGRSEFSPASTPPYHEVVLNVNWKTTWKPDRKGELREVIDEDAPASLRSVNLNDPRLLSQDGCPPAERHPAFPQQSSTRSR